VLPTYLSSDEYLQLVEVRSVLRFAIPEVQNRYLSGSWSFLEIEAEQWIYHDSVSDVLALTNFYINLLSETLRKRRGREQMNYDVVNF
jgi:hypothetical protein